MDGAAWEMHTLSTYVITASVVAKNNTTLRARDGADGFKRTMR